MKPSFDEIWDEDKFHDECGVFGVYAPGEDVARLTFFGLYALQHRGQESAGIAVNDDGTILQHKDMGLVPEIFNEVVLNHLKGKIAIGHVRYSTTGASMRENAQPMVVKYKNGQLALVEVPAMVAILACPLPAIPSGIYAKKAYHKDLYKIKPHRGCKLIEKWNTSSSIWNARPDRPANSSFFDSQALICYNFAT